MARDILLALAVYLLVGWWDAAYVHRRTYGKWTWKWVALAWPIRMWLDLTDPRPAITEWPLRRDEDTWDDCPAVSPGAIAVARTTRRKRR